MADVVDPETLLEWLSMGGEGDMQLIALEQLCNFLLLSDNIDRCFECCPPRAFLPALCRIFLDETANESVLEVTARALTYYLDVSAECTKRIVSVDGSIKAICNRLAVTEIGSRTSKDLSEQCIKVLELICTREAGAVFEAGGLNAVLSFIGTWGNVVHTDTLHSAMSVVSRLCSKMEPHDQKLPSCVESLSLLLRHEDNHVADGALRCFASLSDRFTRRGVDPAPLAEHGLIRDLLLRMSTSLGHNTSLNTSSNRGSLGVNSSANSATNTPSSSEKHTASISTIISLLSTLCRGSPSITNELLRSELPEALEKALKGDERCILDTMRLVDLLMVLLFEGRKALKSGGSISASRLATIRQSRQETNSGEKTHRQLIDCIRSKDTDALVEAVDAGVEVNFMDDVGQTLCNWASAFGTQEMVEFLCEKGADVNKGQRSSSLHYASCFGRPAIAKVLLKYGANPDLRDEDGKTPLDKARERQDEGHREVAAILQSPGEWMCQEIVQRERSKSESSEIEASIEPRGDSPEMAPLYLQRLLPIFCHSYHSTMIPSVRRGSLNIIKKMIHYIPSTLLNELCSPTSPHNGLGSLLVEVIAAVLDNEEDDDGHLIILNMIKDLMVKAKDIFLEHFARLGVFSKVLALCPNDPAEIKKEENLEELSQPPPPPLEDSKEIAGGKPYNWRDFCICRGRDCLYIWNENAALELSNGSNGWFRFVLDGKLATMYSSGSPEGGSESSESRSEFIEKLQKAKLNIKSNQTSSPILSTPSSTTIKVGNWSLSCKKDGELNISNTDGQQTTTLKEDFPGFLFLSNRGTKHSFTAETTLGPEFSEFATGKKGKRMRSKHEAMKAKIKGLAQEIHEGYFAAAQSQPRGVVAKLGTIVAQLERTLFKQNGVRDEAMPWQSILKGALDELIKLLKEESTVSAYELHSSGLVQALIRLLTCGEERDYETYFGKLSRRRSLAMLHQRIEVFKGSFRERSVEGGRMNPAVALVKKLVNVLETIEKLPVLLYESSGANYGLQVLTRRLRFRLEKSPSENSLIDRSGRSLKMEPLTTVHQLENYLLKMVAKNWYDYERSTFTFYKKLKETSPVGFRYQYDFDENGLIYYLGTNAKTCQDWVNPAQYGLVNITCSEGKNLPYGRLEDILNRDASALNCHTNDDKRAYFIIDLGVFIIPSCYTMRHARGYGRSALRNWNFQMSKDSQSWVTLICHENDISLSEPGSTATWQVNPPGDESQGWRYVKISITGKNASGQTHYLSLSGFEIYGKVTGIVDDLGKPAKDSDHRKQRKLMRNQAKGMSVGARVLRGIDWKWKEDHHVGEVGTTPTSLTSNTPSSKSKGKSTGNDGSTSSGASSSSTGKTSILSSRKCSSTSSLPEATEGGGTTPKMSVASTEQASSQGSLVTKMAEIMTDNVITSAATQMNLSESGTGSPSNNLTTGGDDLVVVTPSDLVPLSTIVETSHGEEDSPSKSSTPGDKPPNREGSKGVHSIVEVGIDPRLLYDETEFLNSLKNGKNAVLLASGRPGSAALHQLGSSGVPALKDVMKMIAIRRNMRMEENEASSSGGGGKSRRTLAWLGKSGGSQHGTTHSGGGACKKDGGIPHVETTGTGIPSPPNPKSVSVPNLSYTESPPPSSSSGTTLSPPLTSSGVAFSSSSSGSNNLNNSSNSNSLFDGLSAIARVRSLINSSRFPSLSQQQTNSGTPLMNMNSSASNPATHHAHQLHSTSQQQQHSQQNRHNNDLNSNPNNPFLFGRPTPHSVSSLVRIALSSNFPGGLLSQAQSYPSLSSNNNANAGSSAMTLGQALSLTSTSSDSEQDFLESCRANTLLAELEDDELPEDENDDENNEDDYEGTDTYMYEEAVLNLKEDECFEVRSGKRSWDDEFILRRQFSALIPAFDPRPGRTNVNQITELEIPPPIEVASSSSGDSSNPPEEYGSNLQPKLKLMLRGPNLPGVNDVELELGNPKATIFSIVQDLVQSCGIGSKSDKLRRIWEPTYTIIYREEEKERKEGDDEKGDFGVRSSTPLLSLSQPQCSVDEVISLLRHLYSLNSARHQDDYITGFDPKGFYVPQEEFISSKITNKLSQQLQDPLVLASRALPPWCEEFLYYAPHIFPFDTRNMYFSCTAFGTSRSIVWLQNQRDLSVERNRSSRRDDPHEFRLGRLKHERVKVPRGNNLLEWAIQVMNFHAGRKTVLEIEFQGEDGTGLGPTLEFYALTVAELQRKDLAMWICDDSYEDNRFATPVIEMDGMPKPPGYYVGHKGCGLFPAPIPQDSPVCEKVARYFRFLGIFIAKVFQDNRIIDFPLSRPFFKLLCSGEFGSEVRERSRNERVATPNLDDDLMVSSYISQESEKEMEFEPKYRYVMENRPWYGGILTIEDLMEIDPGRAKFLQQLHELSVQKRHILHDNNLSESDKIRQIQNLALPQSNNEDSAGIAVRLEDLGLNFQYSPSSRVYGYTEYDLIPRGEYEDVTIENMEDYIETLMDFCLNKGINKQLVAFKEGFDSVFPLEKLGAFSPDEVRLMLCGDQSPTWTREDILNYTEPKLGYTKDSPGFLRFVNVMGAMNGEERKSFLQFTTGCSSLPPGGLANLHPHLTVVKKVDAGEGSFPSVNTCVHYLKLPEYSSEEVLKERLMSATREKGFHLN